MPGNERVDKILKRLKPCLILFLGFYHIPLSLYRGSNPSTTHLRVLDMMQQVQKKSFEVKKSTLEHI